MQHKVKKGITIPPPPLSYVFILLLLGSIFTIGYSGCSTPGTTDGNGSTDGGVTADASTEKGVITDNTTTETGNTTEDPPGEPLPPVTKPHPNILLVIIDDYGVDVASYYHDKDGDGKADDGRTYAPTPTFASLCKTGVRFNNAWSTPLCSSTRSSILTGRYGFRTGIGGAIPRGGGIKTNEPTIPKILDAKSALGYVHANIGKWHLGENTELKGELAPNTMGWSHYSGSLSGSLNDFSDWTKITDGKSSKVTNYATTENVNDAIKWLGKQDPKKPWFLWLAFNAPHTPFHMPPKELHSQKNLSGTTQDINRNSTNYYRAAVESLDTEVGRLLAWLKQKGQLENTLIVVLGDNGSPRKVVEAPYDRLRAKGTLYQGGIHVTMCISGKGVTGGQTSDALVHTVDLYATLLEAAGVDVKKELPTGFTYDSMSFFDILKDAKKAGPRTWAFGEKFDKDPKSSDLTIRNKRYKILRLQSKSDAFYDLQTDPRETKNLLDGKKVDDLTAEQKSNYEALSKQLDQITKGN